MFIEMFAMVATVLTIGWYLRHSRKRTEANVDRLKEEINAAILKEQERLAKKRVRDRHKSNHPSS